MTETIGRGAGAVHFEPLRLPEDRAELVALLTSNTFPFHMRTTLTEADVDRRIADDDFVLPEHEAFWVDADGRRLGLVVLEDLEDDTPLFDLRLDGSARGQGWGVEVLRALTGFVFERMPHIRRFEGQTRDDNLAMRKAFVRAGWVKEAHYREGWPVDGGEPRASVAYAILRSDWESGETTPVPCDEELDA